MSSVRTRSPSRGQISFTDRGRALLTGGPVLVGAGVLLGFPDLARIGTALFALAVLTRVVAIRHRPQLTVRRHSDPAPLTVGHAGRVDTTVRNIGPRRTGHLAAIERAPATFGHVAGRTLPPLRVGEETSSTYPFRPAARGRHLLGPLTVTRRDVLGLTRTCTLVGEPSEVVVLPRVHDISTADPTLMGMGQEGDAPAHVLSGTEHDVSVREYRQGDDLRRVHWGVTAHRGQLMVRHEAMPRLRRAVLVLDVSAASWEGQDSVRGRAAFEWAVESLASMAAYLHRLDFTLHLVLPGAHRPGLSADQHPLRALSLQEILVDLACVDVIHGAEEAQGPSTSRSAAVSSASAAQEVAGAGGVIMLVTGDGSTTARQDTFGLVGAGRTGLVLVVRVAPGEATGEATGEASDPAQQLSAYARSGGWHAAVVDPSLPPGQAWSALLGRSEPSVPGFRR